MKTKRAKRTKTLAFYGKDRFLFKKIENHFRKNPCKSINFLLVHLIRQGWELSDKKDLTSKAVNKECCSPHVALFKRNISLTFSKRKGLLLQEMREYVQKTPGLGISQFLIGLLRHGWVNINRETLNLETVPKGSSKDGYICHATQVPINFGAKEETLFRELTGFIKENAGLTIGRLIVYLICWGWEATENRSLPLKDIKEFNAGCLRNAPPWAEPSNPMLTQITT